MATPEAEARIQIDRQLEAAGWVVQDVKGIDLTTGLGVAVREFPLSTGEVDYMLFVDGRAAGVLEAKPEGHTLMGVTTQSGKYQAGTHPALQNTWGSPFPFAYESTGVETQFRDERDPHPRSRLGFRFHKPETLKEFLIKRSVMGEKPRKQNNGYLYMSSGIVELESLVDQYDDNNEVLNQILEELEFRTKPRAARLRERVVVMIKRPLRPAQPAGKGSGPPLYVKRIRTQVKQLTLQFGEVDWITSLYRLHPTKFEEVAIGAFNKLLGFRLTQTKHNGGFDGVGRDPTGRKTVLQAKRYKPSLKITVEQVRGFLGAMKDRHNPDIGIFVTTSDYEKGGRDVAGRHKIYLFSGADLGRIMEAAKIKYDAICKMSE